MATITITITTDNAAFEDDPADEVINVLERLIPKLDRDACEPGSVIRLRDSNGNTVGHFRVSS